MYWRSSSTAVEESTATMRNEEVSTDTPTVNPNSGETLYNDDGRPPRELVLPTWRMAPEPASSFSRAVTDTALNPVYRAISFLVGDSRKCRARRRSASFDFSCISFSQE